MNPVYEKLKNCYDSVRNKTSFEPLVALVLGSGLGKFAEEIDVECKVPYSDIEGFPTSTVPGHAGQFVFGYIDKVPVVCMQGRVHYYEGYPITDVVLPVRLMAMMGAKYLFLTNASGGINRDFKAGDFMMLTDHISCFAPNPLIGPNIDEIGTRFPDMSHVYDPILQDIIMSVADDFEITMQKGVYAQLTGPSFESPAEIRMLAKMGADAVGMSTVVESIAANHMGLKICAISCVCNLAAGISETPLTHDEVQEAAAKAAPLFKQILRESIIRIGAL
ncbi:MAG: purine-nucleoside phosphorylase [Lachnospiraceae bacterium]|nr:purine-nucleoside phosphorylase [Lachnospiraceae bacterium]